MDDQADLKPQQSLVGERDLRLHLGATITRLRNSRGWKQKELARRAGLHPARLSKLEKGTSPAKLHEAVSLARAFETDLDTLALGRRRRAAQGRILEAVDELADITSPAEAEALGRLLQLLLLGCRAAGTNTAGAKRS